MTDRHRDKIFKGFLIEEKYENNIEALKDLPRGLIRNQMTQ